MEDIYSKEILEKIRELEAHRASQKCEGIQNKIKESLDNAAVEINEYGFPYVVYRAK
jgi:hypothetical protein